MAKKNGLPWEVMLCYGIVWDSMEIFRNYMKKKRRQKHESKTNGQNVLQSNFCRAHYYSKTNTRSQK